MTAKAIEICRLSHHYQGRLALNQVSFSVEAGTIHGFVGPNGAGKTTTLKILATLLAPQKGQALVHGSDVVHRTINVRKLIGFMPDHFSMYRRMTCYEYLDFFGAAYGLASVRRARVVADVLALTDMTPRSTSLIQSLSRGMQQRLALARVLVHDPKLLLLDEPASGLDPRARIELMEILRALQKMGKTIFISSHILSELAELCEAVTILDHGRVVFSGPMRDLTVTTDGEGRRRWALRLARPCPELLTVLANTPEVAGAEAAEDGLVLTAAVAGDDPAPLLKAALAVGAVLVSVGEDRRHLNQAFMELTSGGVS